MHNLLPTILADIAGAMKHLNRISSEIGVYDVCSDLKLFHDSTQANLCDSGDYITPSAIAGMEEPIVDFESIVRNEILFRAKGLYSQHCAIQATDCLNEALEKVRLAKNDA